MFLDDQSYTQFCGLRTFDDLCAVPVILKDFYSSNLTGICLSLLETNLNKAKYSFYEKLSRVFSVAGFCFEEK